jgi:hypothetical protein
MGSSGGCGETKSAGMMCDLQPSLPDEIAWAHHERIEDKLEKSCHIELEGCLFR